MDLRNKLNIHNISSRIIFLIGARLQTEYHFLKVGDFAELESKICKLQTKQWNRIISR
jgi:hypothetical protein